MAGSELKTELLRLNMGPQHPATHGVLRLELELDGELIVDCRPHIGYLHRGVEKLAESKSYLSALPLTDRLDYVSSMSNNIGFCLAAERLFGIEAPARAKYIRTMMAEMTRISSHILAVATHALDIGAMSVFLYSFKDRETLLDLFEMVCGARLTLSYGRIGGVRSDVNQEFIDRLYAFTGGFPKTMESEYESLLNDNRIWLKRTKGIGVISAEDAVNWGLTGPTLRGSGVPYDVRKFAPYDAYPEVDFEVPVGKNGDVYDRYRCRMDEMRESVRIIRQCMEKMPDGPILAENAPELDMTNWGKSGKLTPQMSLDHAFVGFSEENAIIFPEGEVYSAVEAPKGELGFYFVSDGSGHPYRMRVRAPSFVHLSVLPKLSIGHLVADVIANIGTIDIVLGECDR